MAAMDNLYKGEKGKGLVVFGMLNSSKKVNDGQDGFLFKVEIPRLLSLLSYRRPDAFIPGVEDIVNGGYKPEFDNIPPEEKERAFSADEKISRGKTAIGALAEYRNAKKAGDTIAANEAYKVFNANFRYFGYGYLNSPESIIPNVPLTFYSFRAMVGLGFYFMLMFVLVLYFLLNEELDKRRWFLWLAIWTIPLAYIAEQAGWIVAEVGRQPWVIQDLLPTTAAVSMIDATSIQVTFWLFAVIFTALLIANIMIMTRQIKLGPNKGGTR